MHKNFINLPRKKLLVRFLDKNEAAPVYHNYKIAGMGRMVVNKVGQKFRLLFSNEQQMHSAFYMQEECGWFYVLANYQHDNLYARCLKWKNERTSIVKIIQDGDYEENYTGPEENEYISGIKERSGAYSSDRFSIEVED